MTKPHSNLLRGARNGTNGQDYRRRGRAVSQCASDGFERLKPILLVEFNRCGLRIHDNGDAPSAFVVRS
jgi:hypothetical protein